MSAIAPSLNFNLSNDDWKNAIQLFDKNWDTRILSVLEEPLNEKPRGAVLAAEMEASACTGGIHIKKEVIRYRYGKKWELRVRTVTFERALKVAELWCKRFAAVCKIWDERCNTVGLAWKYRRILVGLVLEWKPSTAFDKESNLAMLDLERDKAQAINGAKKSRDKALSTMQASYRALDAFIHYKNKNTDDFEKTRDEVLDAIRKANKVTVYDAICAAEYDICYDFRKSIADAAYYATVIKAEDEATAAFQKLFDEIGVSLQKTQDKTTSFFQKFNDSLIPEPFRISRIAAIFGQQDYRFPFYTFKKSQDGVVPSFKKFRDLSINVKKAINKVSTSALKSARKGTVEATIFANVCGAFKKIRYEAITARQAQDRFIAALEKEDKDLALLLKDQDKVLVATQDLQDQGEALFFLLRDEHQGFVNLLKKHREALASLLKVQGETFAVAENLQGEGFTRFLWERRKVISSLLNVQNEGFVKGKSKQDKDKFLASLIETQDQAFTDLHKVFKITVNSLLLS